MLNWYDKVVSLLCLREIAGFTILMGCNSCVPDEYIEKKKRSVLIDILHLLIRFSIVIDISQFLTTRQERLFFFMS